MGFFGDIYNNISSGIHKGIDYVRDKASQAYNWVKDTGLGMAKQYGLEFLKNQAQTMLGQGADMLKHVAPGIHDLVAHHLPARPPSKTFQRNS
jgi:hypothetical protein